MVRLYRRSSHGAVRMRSMYPGGRADRRARAYARLWAAVFGVGLLGRRWVTLEVVGRHSGQVRRLPLGMARHGGQWYLVSMLGEGEWVRNVRAARGRAVIRNGRRYCVHLIEMPVGDRAPIIKAYLQQVPGGRPHIPIDPDAPVEEFVAVAPTTPVFPVDLARGRRTLPAE